MVHNNQINKKKTFILINFVFKAFNLTTTSLVNSTTILFVCLCFVTLLINFVAVTNSPGITLGIYTKMSLLGKSWILSFLRTMVGIISGVVVESTDMGNERHYC